MDSCLHRNSSEREWLPLANDLFKPHLHCEEYSTLKNTSWGEKRRSGCFVSVLHDLKNNVNKKNLKTSKAQKRGFHPVIQKVFEAIGENNKMFHLIDPNFWLSV